MKRIIWLTAAALMCALCMLSASAAGTATPSETAPSPVIETAQDADEVEADGINLRVATTAIIIICAALGAGVIAGVVTLGLRNRSKARPAKK